MEDNPTKSLNSLNTEELISALRDKISEMLAEDPHVPILVPMLMGFLAGRLERSHKAYSLARAYIDASLPYCDPDAVDELAEAYDKLKTHETVFRTELG